MIRFIDIRGQDTGHNFAFFNTVTDKFLEVGGEMAWKGLDDFKGICRMVEDEKLFERCKRLCPDWVIDIE